MEFLEPPTYLLSCCVLCCTCLMFDCVRKVVGKLANIAIIITLQRSRALITSINVQACYNKLANIANKMSC